MIHNKKEQYEPPACGRVLAVRLESDHQQGAFSTLKSHMLLISRIGSHHVRDMLSVTTFAVCHSKWSRMPRTLHFLPRQDGGRFHWRGARLRLHCKEKLSQNLLSTSTNFRGVIKNIQGWEYEISNGEPALWAVGQSCNQGCLREYYPSLV